MTMKRMLCGLLAVALLAGCSGASPGVRGAELTDAETVRLLEQFVQWHEAFDVAWDKSLAASVEVVLLQKGRVKYSGATGLLDKGECRLALAVMEQQIGGIPVFKAAITQVGMTSSMYAFDVEEVDLRGVRFDIAPPGYGKEEIISGARLPLYGVFYRDEGAMPDDPDFDAEIAEATVSVVFYLTIA